MEGISIHVLTIFPGMFDCFLRYGIIRRAVERNLLRVFTVDIRESATDRHQTVDDAPYGGGAGMIMRADVLAASLKTTEPFQAGRAAPVIYLSPQGKRFDQKTANRLSLLNEFVLVCGRYRGIDERFIERYVTEELSIGDYVLFGGEAPAMVVIEAVTRLIPGVMHDFESGLEDSFQDSILDCPWYTRPDMFEGMRVPEELLSGDHARIQQWRRRMALEQTRRKRPDLLER
ncbi:MAG: tRNA (guanosine(37)-N1)-methyltransferase TrmD [Candidatus Latescibacterota bacterium]